MSFMEQEKRAPLAESELTSMMGTPRPAHRQLSLRKIPTALHCLGDLDSVTLSWNNLNVYLPPPAKKCCGLKKAEGDTGERKHILKNVSGLVQSGECMALMGASGAGKTTLMNTLNGRNRGSLEVDGLIAVNGHQIAAGDITSISGYVQQVDLFISTITVREQLNFHASLRMDPGIPQAAREERVEEVISDLGLAKSANVRMVNISGGEKKRVAFACEVLTDPPLLFCDEPTTGLDSFMAETVVGVMKKLAARGKAILCTIHQPSSQVFALFDRVFLLAEGRVAFLGPRDGASLFFAGVGLPIPEDYNPGDFYVHTLAIMPGSEDRCRQKVTDICNQFEISKSWRGIQEQVESNSNSRDVDDVKAVICKKRSPYKATWARQMRSVLWRTAITIWREPMLLRVRFFQVIVLGIMFGLIYFRQKMTNEGVMNINGILYMFLMQMTMGNVFAVVNAFTAELPVFLNEHYSGMYRTDVYYLCKTIVDVPVFILLPFTMVTIIYWMAGLNPSASSYFAACAISALVANVAVSFGYIVACAFQTTQLAIAVGMTVLMPLTLFGGLFLNLRTIPVWLKWIEYVSWFRYANEALVVNQWNTIENIECTIANFTCARDGPQVLAALNFQPSNFSMDIAILGGMILAFRSIAFLALYFRVARS